jgi:acetyl esterase/lipase
LTLDLYAPLFPEYARVPNPLAPVIIFFPPQLRPFTTCKTIFSSLGENLAETVGTLVIIPDLTNYPMGKVRHQIEDARLVLHWTAKNVHRYGGDPRKIYLSGMGLGGLLAQLVPLQAAIVTSRNQILVKEGDAEVDLPTGVKDVQVGLHACRTAGQLFTLSQEYGNASPLPHLEGLIL